MHACKVACLDARDSFSQHNPTCNVLDAYRLCDITWLVYTVVAEDLLYPSRIPVLHRISSGVLKRLVQSLIQICHLAITLIGLI
jgi:hypothetical protein